MSRNSRFDCSSANKVLETHHRCRSKGTGRHRRRYQQTSVDGPQKVPWEQIRCLKIPDWMQIFEGARHESPKGAPHNSVLTVWPRYEGHRCHSQPSNPGGLHPHCHDDALESRSGATRNAQAYIPRHRLGSRPSNRGDARWRAPPWIIPGFGNCIPCQRNGQFLSVRNGTPNHPGMQGEYLLRTWWGCMSNADRC
jgi:hypothetical protein